MLESEENGGGQERRVRYRRKMIKVRQGTQLPLSQEAKCRGRVQQVGLWDNWRGFSLFLFIICFVIVGIEYRALHILS